MGLLRAANTTVKLISVLEEPMKKREVHRVDIPLVRLKVIAFVKNLRDVKMVERRVEKFIRREQWRLSGSHVTEDNSASFRTGIREVFDRVTMVAAPRLTRLLQTTSLDVIQPAMIEAAEPAVLDSAIAQICSPMRAMQRQEPKTALIVAEQHQLLAQDFHTHRRGSLRQLFR
jgi:hypothetical protein